MQRGIAVNGILPYLESIRSKVYFGVGIAVENARFLREEVADALIVAIILEKGFVCADDLGIFLQSLTDTGTQADDPFDTIRRQEGVAENGLCLLANAVHTPDPLDQADDSPG